jgi:hypothetical protein
VDSGLWLQRTGTGSVSGLSSLAACFGDMRRLVDVDISSLREKSSGSASGRRRKLTVGDGTMQSET